MEQTDSPPAAPARKHRRKRALVAQPRSQLPARETGEARDAEEYDWVPVLRKRRSDGWSPSRQRVFIEALADTGSVEMAASMADMSVRCCYKLRRAPGSEGFAAAWAAAVDSASQKLVDVAFDRAIRGTTEPVYLRDGSIAGYRVKYNDKLLMMLLRAYQPERFRHAALSARHPAETPPPPLVQVATALEQLDPPRPEAPHLLMAPDQLAQALFTADLTPEKLPHWIPDVDPEREKLARTNPMPLGEDFERGLENAKREINHQPPFTDEEWTQYMRDRGWHKWPPSPDL
jgi:hypothetical protein